MAVLDSLRQTPGTLQRNPIVFVPVFVLVLLYVPEVFLRAIDPLVASVFSVVIILPLLLIAPFFQGGIIGMADEALQGRTSLETFLSEGKSNYVSILAVVLLLMAINVVLVPITMMVTVIGAFMLPMGSGEGASVAGLVIFGAIVLLLALAYFIVLFFIQFYAQAIVIDDLGPIDALKHSLAVVRLNLVRTLEYTVIVGVLGGMVGVANSAATILASTQSSTPYGASQLSMTTAFGISLLVLVLGTLIGTVLGVYSVAFYRSIDSGVAD